MKRVLIAGGSGFIGANVFNRLSALKGYAVECVSLRDEGWRKLDFSRFDSVLMAAGVAHVTPKPEMAATYMKINRDLPVELARRARDGGAGQLIFLSSVIVYGDAAPAGMRRVIDRQTPPCPVNAYGQSKLEAEDKLAALACAGFSVANVRLPMVYGAGCRGNYRMLERFAGRLSCFPRFENRRSLIYVENLAEFIRQLIDRNAGGLFFPQNARTASTGEIVQAIARAKGKALRLVPGFGALIRLLGRRGTLRRAFGDMAVDPELSCLDWDYCRYDLDASVRRIERIARGETDARANAREETHG